LNLRPLGYEPNELPDCSTPHIHGSLALREGQTFSKKNSGLRGALGACRSYGAEAALPAVKLVHGGGEVLG
jgi:hypothetical protein